MYRRDLDDALASEIADLAQVAPQLHSEPGFAPLTAETKTSIDCKRAEGNSTREAIRCLKQGAKAAAPRDTERAMPQENVEVVRQAIESNRSADLEARIEAALALWDPGCEYTRVTAAVDAQTYRGHDGIRRYMSDMADSWAEWRIEAEEVFEVAPDTVVATARFRSTARASGAPIEAYLGAVFVLSHGKILRGQVYPSRQEALEALGLR